MASALLMLMPRLTTAATDTVLVSATLVLTPLALGPTPPLSTAMPALATAMVLATAMASALLMLMPRLTTAATDTVLVSATLVLTPLALGPTPPQSTAMPALATAMASAPLMLMLRLTMAATDTVLVSATLVL